MALLRPVSELSSSALLATLHGYGILGFAVGTLLGAGLVVIVLGEMLGHDGALSLYLSVPLLLLVVLAIEIYMRRTVVPELARRLGAHE